MLIHTQCRDGTPDHLFVFHEFELLVFVVKPIGHTGKSVALSSTYSDIISLFGGVGV